MSIGDTLAGALELSGLGRGVDKNFGVKFDIYGGGLVEVDLNTHTDNAVMSNHLFEFALWNKNIPFLRSMVKFLGDRALPACCYAKGGASFANSIDKMMECLRLMKISIMEQCIPALECLASFFSISDMGLPDNINDLQGYQAYDNLVGSLNSGTSELEQFTGEVQTAKPQRNLYLQIEYETLLMALSVCQKRGGSVALRSWLIELLKKVIECYSGDEHLCVDFAANSIVAYVQAGLGDKCSKNLLLVTLYVVSANSKEKKEHLNESMEADELVPFILKNENHVQRIRQVKHDGSKFNTKYTYVDDSLEHSSSTLLGLLPKTYWKHLEDHPSASSSAVPCGGA